MYRAQLSINFNRIKHMNDLLSMQRYRKYMKILAPPIHEMWIIISYYFISLNRCINLIRLKFVHNCDWNIIKECYVIHSNKFLLTKMLKKNFIRLTANEHVGRTFKNANKKWDTCVLFPLWFIHNALHVKNHYICLIVYRFEFCNFIVVTLPHGIAKITI